MSLAILAAAAAVFAPSQSSPPAGATRLTDVSGVYLVSETMYENRHGQHENHLQLDGSNRIVDLVNLPASVQCESNYDRLTISAASMSGNTLWIDADATVTVSPHHAGRARNARLRRAASTGTLTVCGIRLTNNGGPQNLASAAAVADNIFGTFLGSGTQTFTVRDQFRQCSNNQMNLIPSTQSSLTDGTRDLSTLSNGDATGSLGTVRDAVVADLPFTADESICNLLLIYQPGSSFAATAFVNGHESRYVGSATTHVSTHMHEIGHNFGLGHANEGNAEYEDRTGAMGIAVTSSSNNRGFAQCFNPDKSNQLGWYLDRTTTFTSCPASPQTITLTGPASYKDLTGSDAQQLDVVLTMGGTTFHVGFNGDNGANAGTREAPDLVTVQEREVDSSPLSFLDAKLEVGEVFTRHSFGQFQVVVDSINTGSTPPTATITVSCQAESGNAAFRVTSGACQINADGSCIMDAGGASRDYGSEENCQFQVIRDTTLTATTFSVSQDDDLVIDGSTFTGNTGPSGLAVSNGDTITWLEDDDGDEGTGFVVCAETIVTNSPTTSPTSSPSVSPTTSAPTTSPTTSAPTTSPTTSAPTVSPTTSPTTSSPTASPTSSPTTSAPTQSPTTSSPTTSPTTASPSTSPTVSPTASPTTPAPTTSPTTSAPTTSPTTSSPTTSPTTSSPTVSPTASPTTSSPTVSPTSSPTTSAPTQSPTTSSPTTSPTTSSPTAAPTVSPTTSPTTSSPTTSPTTSSPTASPTVDAGMGMGMGKGGSMGMGMSMGMSSPTQPTPAPSTAAPTAPTPAPTSAPTAKKGKSKGKSKSMGKGMNKGGKGKKSSSEEATGGASAATSMIAGVALVAIVVVAVALIAVKRRLTRNLRSNDAPVDFEGLYDGVTTINPIYDADCAAEGTVDRD
eukprot:m.32386 g.32386  ORF g.32386 m.32386 type:complete len:905 (+) comp7041_c0_seq1:528-3242(+)